MAPWPCGHFSSAASARSAQRTISEVARTAASQTNHTVAISDRARRKREIDIYTTAQANELPSDANP
jgi:hypothetical protein